MLVHIILLFLITPFDFDQGGSFFPETNCSEQDESVETQYYNELVSIDKQHHTVLYSSLSHETIYYFWIYDYLYFLGSIESYSI